MQTLQNILKAPLEVSTIFNSVLQSRIDCTGISGTKDSTRVLVNANRDTLEMLGYFREYKNHSASDAFVPLVRRAMSSEFGILSNPFEDKDIHGKKVVPGFSLELLRSTHNWLLQSQEAYGRETFQEFINDVLYTGSLLSFPEYGLYDDTRVSIPNYRFQFGLTQYREYNNEIATVLEDSSVLSHTIKVECLGDELELPKYWLYEV